MSNMYGYMLALSPAKPIPSFNMQPALKTWNGPEDGACQVYMYSVHVIMIQSPGYMKPATSEFPNPHQQYILHTLSGILANTSSAMIVITKHGTLAQPCSQQKLHTLTLSLTHTPPLSLSLSPLSLSLSPLSLSLSLQTRQLHDVNGWTEDEVADWFYSLGDSGSSDLAAYAEDFIKNNITGRRLFLLTGDDLLQIGVFSVGHRREIMVRKFKNELELFLPPPSLFLCRKRLKSCVKRTIACCISLLSTRYCTLYLLLACFNF